MTFREIRLRAIQAENDYYHAARTGAEPTEALRLWRRKEYWAAREYFERLRIENGEKFRFYHEFKVWQRARRAAWRQSASSLRPVLSQSGSARASSRR